MCWGHSICQRGEYIIMMLLITNCLCVWCSEGSIIWGIRACGLRLRLNSTPSRGPLLQKDRLFINDIFQSGATDTTWAPLKVKPTSLVWERAECLSRYVPTLIRKSYSYTDSDCEKTPGFMVRRQQETHSQVLVLRTVSVDHLHKKRKSTED